MHVSGRVSRASTLVLAIAAMLGVACSSGDDGTGAALAERWLRVAEDHQTNVLVYEKEVPPLLSALLNPDADDDTPDDDLVEVPVHPDGELLGSYVVRRTDGVTLVWLFFDVEASTLGEVTKAITPQLDESPWQVIGQQANRSYTVTDFLSTRSEDIDGTAIVEPSPSTEPYEITVDRDGTEVTVEIARGALSPLIEAELDDDLTIEKIDIGLATEGGLREDDRIIRVGNTDVSSPDELAEAMEALASEPTTVSITYLMQIAPGIAIDETPTFVAPSGIELPDDFPLGGFLNDFIVEQFQTLQDPTGEFYAASLLSTGGSAEVADQFRAGLADEGWTVVADEAVGFATSITFTNADGGLQGEVSIDVFPGDEDLIQAVVQIQSAAPTGN